ncbi:MAG TPA: response regulator [Allocoleopsis sp.]
MLRILIVDDNPHDRILAIRSLEREFPELQVQEVAKAEDLDRALERGDFDVVITDYQLRWSDGLTVFRAIKARFPDCPVIMFTNSGTQEIAVEAMKAGLDDYVLKSSKHYIRLAAAVRLAWKNTEIRRKAAGLENRWQGLLNQLNVGIFRLSEDGALLEANPAFLSLLGLGSLSDSLGRSMESYFQPEDYARLLHQLKEKGQIRNDEVQLRRADGASIWVRLSETNSRVDGQTIIEGLIEDISDRFLAEQALKASESRFRRLVAANMIGCTFWDISGKITDANDAFLRMVGYTRDDLLAGKLNWKTMTPAEQLHLSEQAIVQMREFGAASAFEKDYICSDGSRVPAIFGGVLLEGSEDQGVSFVLDLSERKQLENQLRQQAEQLEQANRLKDEFLAVLSHELRSPLNSILGWAKLLRTRNFDPATMTRAIETIERNATLQTQLIEDLLDVSRILQGKISLNVIPTNLASTIKAALETMHLAAQAKSIQVECLLDSSVGLVSGDPNRLQQVVWNLLSNAIKFTPPGGRVQISLKNQGSQAQIQVRDTGKGISAEFLPHVFDYFRQADASTTRSQGGLGLGLAIVRHLVELHGGTVSADSPGAGQGATFTVKLPLMNDRVESDRQPESFDNAPDLAGVRVLVVEDDTDSRELITFVLEQYGAEAIAVASTAQALSTLEQLKPDVLVSDIGMPQEDGYALIRKVRANESNPADPIPAVALTAYAREEDYQRAIEAGFQRHIPKPVEPNELVAAVAQLVGRPKPI